MKRRRKETPLSQLIVLTFKRPFVLVLFILYIYIFSFSYKVLLLKKKVRSDGVFALKKPSMAYLSVN